MDAGIGAKARCDLSVVIATSRPQETVRRHSLMTPLNASHMSARRVGLRNDIAARGRIKTQKQVCMCPQGTLDKATCMQNAPCPRANGGSGGNETQPAHVPAAGEQGAKETTSLGLKPPNRAWGKAERGAMDTKKDAARVSSLLHSDVPQETRGPDAIHPDMQRGHLEGRETWKKTTRELYNRSPEAATSGKPCAGPEYILRPINLPLLRKEPTRSPTLGTLLQRSASSRRLRDASWCPFASRAQQHRNAG